MHEDRRFDALRLDRHADQPIATQLASKLHAMIEDQTLRPGDMFPSELDLCTMYGISRTTVRGALQKLEKEGLIERIKGRGTFVTAPGASNSHCLRSLTFELADQGLPAQTKILSFSIVEPPQEVGEVLCIDALDVHQAYEIHRLRVVDDVPIIKERIYVPVAVCPGLNAKLLERTSLYDLLRKLAGVVPTRAQEKCTAAVLGHEEACALGCEEPSPAFRIRRVTYDRRVGAFELTYLTVRADRCSYEVDLQPEDISVHRRYDG